MLGTKHHWTLNRSRHRRTSDPAVASFISIRLYFEMFDMFESNFDQSGETPKLQCSKSHATRSLSPRLPRMIFLSVHEVWHTSRQGTSQAQRQWQSLYTRATSPVRSQNRKFDITEPDSGKVSATWGVAHIKHQALIGKSQDDAYYISLVACQKQR